MLRLYLREVDGRLLPCLKDGTLLDGVSQVQVIITPNAATEATIQFYPAGLIQSDGSLKEGVNKGFLP